MDLKYDFDILDLSSEGAAERLALHDTHALGNAAVVSKTQVIAMFRDQQTVDALLRGPSALLEYFRKSGFGVQTLDSGAPRNRYPAEDEAARLAIIELLAKNVDAAAISEIDDEAAEPGSFRLADFLQHLTEATPVLPATVVAPAVDAISEPVDKLDAGSVSGSMVGVSVISSFGSRLLRGVAGLRGSRR